MGWVLWRVANRTAEELSLDVQWDDPVAEVVRASGRIENKMAPESPRRFGGVYAVPQLLRTLVRAFLIGRRCSRETTRHQLIERTFAVLLAATHGYPAGELYNRLASCPYHVEEDTHHQGNPLIDLGVSSTPTKGSKGLNTMLFHDFIEKDIKDRCVIEPDVPAILRAAEAGAGSGSAPMSLA